MFESNFTAGSWSLYHNNPKYWDRQAEANSVDPNMLQNMAFDQGLHCLLLDHQFLDSSRGSQMDLFEF